MKLYHGSIIENEKSICGNGLSPQKGNFVQDMYNDNCPDLVFFCDEDHLSKAFSSICYAIYRKLNLKSVYRVTADQVREHGVLFVVENDNFSFRASSESREAHYPSVERNDYYTDKNVKVIKTIKNDELMQLAAKHAPILFEKKAESKGGFGGL